MGKLYWNGDVGWYDEAKKEGITTAMVKKDLAEAGGADLEVELSTFGGNFFDGVAILDLLKAYRGKVSGVGSSVVASAGTVISLGFKPFKVRKTTMFMVHNAQAVSVGDHNKMREDADLYERMSNLVAQAYAARTGKTVEEMKALMDKETWLMGQEIVDMGFADGLIEGDEELDSPTMALLMAQKGFQDRVTMWAKMPQKADKKAKIEMLIESGAVDRVSKWDPKDDDETDGLSNEYQVTMNGKVYRSGLRKVAALAAKKADRETEEWATSMLAKIDKGETRVNKETVFVWLKDNPGIPLSEIAAVMGQSGALMSADARAAVEMKTKLDAAGLADPIGMFATMKADLEKVEADKFKVAMSENFGPEKYENGQENLLRQYAETKLKGVKSVELAAKVEEFKKDPLALKLAGERMDANADVNVFGKSEKGGAPGSAGNGGFERHLKL